MPTQKDMKNTKTNVEIIIENMDSNKKRKQFQEYQKKVLETEMIIKELQLSTLRIRELYKANHKPNTVHDKLAQLKMRIKEKIV